MPVTAVRTMMITSVTTVAVYQDSYQICGKITRILLYVTTIIWTPLVMITLFPTTATVLQVITSRIQIFPLLVLPTIMNSKAIIHPPHRLPKQ